jgi:tonB-linked outer membrane protein, susC/ragA family
MVSYFGKVNYAFDDKYLISGTVRRDASSRFGKGNNSAIFPSVSAGWRVSREKFMECTQNWLSDLKLRASWGINGNDQIDNNATYNLYYTNMSNGSYNFNGDGTTVLPGVQKDRSGNNDLKWEETKQLNFGIDAAFFDNRLGLTLDYFQKKTTGMLIQKPYIGVIGEGGYKWYNAASMDNSGVEATFTWRDEIKDFKYDISFNLSYYKNEITELPDVIKYTWGGGNGVDKTIVGQPYGSWMSYKADGVFKTKQEVYEYLSKYDVQIGAPGVGRIRYKDLNGDNIINTADMDWQGSDQPRFIGGLNIGASYKGFDLSVFFNGMIRDAWNNSKFYTDLFQGWTGNHSVRLMDAMHAWNAYEQTGVYNCDIPALTVVDNNVETRSSTFFIEDGSYVKLKTLTVGYTFPDKWIKKAHLSNLRLYLQAQNVFTLTNYTGADPEGLGYPYPQPRTYTFGLSLGF